MSDIEINLNDLESWLRGDGFAENTVQQTVGSAKTILERIFAGEPVGSTTMMDRARRIQSYGQDRELAWSWGREWDAVDLEAVQEARRAARRKGRKQTAESFDDKSWRRLALAIVAAPPRDARVLELMMLSGLRAFDALNIRREAITEALETGRLKLVQKGGTATATQQEQERILVLGEDLDPLRIALIRALAQWQSEDEKERRNAKTIAEWIVPASDARIPYDSARRTIYNFLRRLGAEAEVKGRIHLHRMRRTIAVQALRASVDIIAVGQLLGHKPGSRATLGYLDEARLDDVASVRKAVHDRFLK